MKEGVVISVPKIAKKRLLVRGFECLIRYFNSFYIYTTCFIVTGLQQILCFKDWIWCSEGGFRIVLPQGVKFLGYAVAFPVQIITGCKGFEPFPEMVKVYRIPKPA